MAQVKARRNLGQTSIEFRSFRGGKRKEVYYVLVKGRRAGSDFWVAFTATELKGACIDILGLPDDSQTRKTNANEFARRVWKS